MDINTNILIYRHVKPDGEVFYIGIGDSKRPYAFKNRNKFWKSITAKYPNYEIEILKKHLSWEDACELEKILINYYGRRDLGLGTLCNLTDGGDGTLNHIVSEKHKEILRAFKLNKKDSIQTKIKKSLYSKNRPALHTNNILKKIKKPVLQYSLEGEFIKEWESLKIAEDNNKGYIRGCISGLQRKSGNYIWKYK